MPIFEVDELPKTLRIQLGEYAARAKTMVAYYCSLSRPSVNDILQYACGFSAERRPYAIRMLESYAMKQINKTNHEAIIPSGDIDFLKGCIARGWPNI
jgi:hypothetical protein